MFQLFNTPASYGLCLARLGLALLLMYQAANFLLLPEGLEIDTTSFLPSVPIAFAIAELIIGFLLLLGFLTRLMALAVVGIRVYAALALIPPPTISVLEAHIAVALLCLLLLFTGGGAWSLDRHLAQRFLP